MNINEEEFIIFIPIELSINSLNLTTPLKDSEIDNPQLIAELNKQSSMIKFLQFLILVF